MKALHSKRFILFFIHTHFLDAMSRCSCVQGVSLYYASGRKHWQSLVSSSQQKPQISFSSKTVFLPQLPSHGNNYTKTALPANAPVINTSIHASYTYALLLSYFHCLNSHNASHGKMFYQNSSPISTASIHTTQATVRYSIRTPLQSPLPQCDTTQAEVRCSMKTPPQSPLPQFTKRKPW